MLWEESWPCVEIPFSLPQTFFLKEYKKIKSPTAVDAGVHLGQPANLPVAAERQKFLQVTQVLGFCPCSQHRAGCRLQR